MRIHPAAWLALIVGFGSALLLLAFVLVPRLDLGGIPDVGNVFDVDADEVDPFDTELSIQEWAESRRGLGMDRARVSCPSGVKIEAGREFNCVLRSRGISVGVEVTIENDEGALTWGLRS